MGFTVRELQLITVIASNTIEDTVIAMQKVQERTGVTDEEMQVYLDELRALKQKAVEEQSTRPDYGPDNEPPIEAYEPEEAEELYEPTPEDLAALDTEFDTGSEE